MTEETLRYLVEVNDRDLRDLKKRVTETNKVLGEDTAKAADKAGSSFSGFGGKAQLVAGGALLALGKGAQVAAMRASDLGEQMSKSSAVFGTSSVAIGEWSKTTAKSLGISRVAALEATGTFGNMLIPMGIGKKRAAEMSKTMVTLAADMASFNNASPEETLAAISSGLAGETEPLRRFGVFLNADRIAAEALALGLGKTKKPSLEARAALYSLEVATAKHAEAVKEHGKNSLEATGASLAMERAQAGVKKAAEGSASGLSAAAKSQASYSLIMKDMKKSGSVGDFAKTSGSAANALRIQKATTDDLVVSTGQRFLPVQSAAIGLIGTATGALFANQTAGMVVVGMIAALAVGVFAVNAAIKVHAAYVNAARIANALFGAQGKATILVTKAWTLAQKGLNLALRMNPIGLVITALVLLGAAFFALWKKSETFRTIVTGALNVVKTAALGVGNFFRDTFGPAVTKVADAVGTAFGKVKTLFGWFRDNANEVWKIVSKGISLYLTPYRVAIDLIGAGLGKMRDVFGWLRDNADRIVGKLKPLGDLLGKVGGFLGKLPGVGDVAAGMNSAAAASARSSYAAAAGGDTGGLSARAAGMLRTISSVFGGVTMTSGRRSFADNKRVGGAPNSDHLTGNAFDLVPSSGWNPASIAHFDQIAGWLASLPSVRWIGWRGVPNHGPYDHLHVSMFDQGGFLPTGVSLARNDTGRPEMILPNGNRLVETLAAALRQAGGGAGGGISIERLEVREIADVDRVADAVWRRLAVR